MLIPTPDDRNERLSSSFLYKTTRISRYTTARYHLGSRGLNQFGEKQIEIMRPDISNRRHKLGYDPILERVKEKVSKLFMTPERGYAEYDDDWVSYFGWKYGSDTVLLCLTKVNGLFLLNNVKKNKEDCASAIAKVILYGTTNRSADSLKQYIRKNVSLSQNIIYALENRTPYWFFKDGRKVECRINMQLIDDNEIALEISDGVWGSMKMKDANIFINSYRNSSTRSKKWSNLSPMKLFKAVMKRDPSESEHKLMVAWLMQNRTSKMVEDRATVLLQEMTERYDDMILLDAERTQSYLQLSSVNPDYKYAVLVRGKIGDWIIYANNSNSKFQRVSAVFCKAFREFDGPFCIDNLHDNSSIGDQIASRAMILKNDEQAKTMIHTIRRVEKTGYRISKSTITEVLDTTLDDKEMREFLNKFIKEENK